MAQSFKQRTVGDLITAPDFNTYEFWDRSSGSFKQIDVADFPRSRLDGASGFRQHFRDINDIRRKYGLRRAFSYDLELTKTDLLVFVSTLRLPGDRMVYLHAA